MLATLDKENLVQTAFDCNQILFTFSLIWLSVLLSLSELKEKRILLVFMVLGDGHTWNGGRHHSVYELDALE